MNDSLEELEQRRVVLTASPLQRIGAFALTALARVSNLEDLTVEKFDYAVNLMTEHLKATADASETKEKFWLSASYWLWPNSKINPTARRKQQPSYRRDQIQQWRRRPDVVEWPGAPCAYCDRQACGWYGKVDILLGVSVGQRNTTAPGHEGTPLCYACLASLWACPYGTRLSGGRAAAIHSWDDIFLAKITRSAVGETLQTALFPPVKVKNAPFAQELMVLTAVRTYGRRIESPVELMVLSNPNQDPSLHTQEMSHPAAEWLRSTLTDPRRRAGYSTLVATQQSKKVPGEAFLARLLFQAPGDVLGRIESYLLRRFTEQRKIPAEAAVLAPLVYSYFIEVLNMDEKDSGELRELAERVAALLGADNRPGPFTEFVRANGKGGNLEGWFRTKNVDCLLRERPEGVSRTLLTARDSQLLFDDDRWWAHRRLLFFSVIDALIAKNWQPRGSQDELDAAVEEAEKNVNEHEGEVG